MTRHNVVAKAIERGDIAELLQMADGRPCACLGPRDGENLCPCRMTAMEVRNAVSYAALKRGRLVRLAP